MVSMATGAAPSAPPAELRELVHEQMRRWSVPGVAVGLLHDGRIESWGFGVTHMHSGYPVLPETLFQIGSISKIFTATAIMQLVDAGAVQLDAPLKRALPSFTLADPAAAETVTLRHLLTHTGGFFGDNFKDYGVGDDALGRAMAEFGTLRQITPVGAHWSYCNTAFQAMGALLERQHSGVYEQIIKQRLFAPLGLEHTTFFADEAITFSAAAGHNKYLGRDQEIARPYPVTRAMAAAGAIISTTSDLLRFAQFHMGDGTAGDARVLSAEAIRQMQQPQGEGGMTDQQALGWMIRRFDNGDITFGHGGSTNGFRAWLAVAPAQQLALAVLTNGSDGVAVYRAIDEWLLERYAGLRHSDPLTTPLPAAALDRFAGTYGNERSTVTVTAEADGTLSLDASSLTISGEAIKQPTVHARPIAPTRFLVTDTAMAGSWADFIGDGVAPRFVRFGGRLLDRA